MSILSSVPVAQSHSLEDLFHIPATGSPSHCSSNPSLRMHVCSRSELSEKEEPHTARPPPSQISSGVTVGTPLCGTGQGLCKAELCWPPGGARENRRPNRRQGAPVQTLRTSYPWLASSSPPNYSSSFSKLLDPRSTVSTFCSSELALSSMLCQHPLHSRGHGPEGLQHSFQVSGNLRTRFLSPEHLDTVITFD